MGFFSEMKALLGTLSKAKGSFFNEISLLGKVEHKESGFNCDNR